MVKITRQSVTIAARGTDHTATFTATGDIKGWVKLAVLTTPDYTNARTTTPSVQNVWDETVYTGAAQNENTEGITVLPNSSTSTTSPFYIEPGYTITMTTADAVGTGGGTVYWTLYIDDGK